MAREMTPLSSQRWAALIISGTPHSGHTSIPGTISPSNRGRHLLNILASPQCSLKTYLSGMFGLTCGHMMFIGSSSHKLVSHTYAQPSTAIRFIITHREGNHAAGDNQLYQIVS
jgi:hypothetical protein